jgi:hypothetical protein
MEKGDKVIHEGQEKVVEDITGEVLILSDKKCVSRSDVCMMTEENQATPEAEMPQSEEMQNLENTERTALRNAIEDMNENSPVSTVMNVLGRIEGSMSLKQGDDFEAFKKSVIRKALELRKINPKKCESCGQTIPE